MEDLTKLSEEDLNYYLEIFKRQNKLKLAERIRNEIERRKLKE